MERKEWSLPQLIAKAEAYCAAGEHCQSDVNSKLLQWGATAEQIATILEHLVQLQYINEQRYAAAVVHDKLQYQGWGRIKIRLFLQTKHLPASVIDEAINDMDEAQYTRVLKRIVYSKKRTIKSTDTLMREKVIRFCLQRGFTYDEVNKVV